MIQAAPALMAAIRTRLREGRLPCEEAFALAREQQKTPQEVATVADSMDIRVGWCQLGLFAGPGKKEKSPYPGEVPAELRAQIEKDEEEGCLSCAHAWAIARRLGLERIQVGQAADALSVCIGHCQLGCF